MRVQGGREPGREHVCLIISYAIDSETGKYTMHPAFLAGERGNRQQPEGQGHELGWS